MSDWTSMRTAPAVLAVAKASVLSTEDKVAEVTRRLTETDEERRIREQREWLEQFAAMRQQHRKDAATAWGRQIDGIIYDCMFRQAK